MVTKIRYWVGYYALIGALAVLVLILGFLQFRWSDQLQRADLERKQAALQAGMNGFREDLRRELAGVCVSFGFRPVSTPPGIEGLYARECGDWARSSDHRELVANYYLWKAAARGHSFLQFDPQSNSFQAVTCPSRLGSLCDDPMPDHPGPMFGVRWRLQADSLVMVRAIPTPNRFGPGSAPGCPPDCSSPGFMLIDLNRDYLLGHYLPELAQRYFGAASGMVFDVGIVNDAKPPQFFFSSQTPPPAELISSPDQSLPLFPPRPPRAFEPRSPDFRPELRGSEHREMPFFPDGGRERMGPPRGPFPTPFLTDEAAAGWRLVVRHHGASLAQAVAAARERDLLLGFGVLAVLVAGMALVFVGAQRAQRLAKMQMEFVAGVSHELRTPVSVIASAAANLADGLVKSPPQVEQYGVTIRNEAKRLAAMIEHVLLFAATRSKRPHYELQPVPVEETVDAVLASLSHLIGTNGFTVEKRIAPGLPPVWADPKMLGQCLSNLITNALKYGSAGHWMALRAEPGVGGEANLVLITVQDHGQGIAADEIPRLFEPFFRGKSALGSRVHGAGLGLSLAKEAVETMGGKLTVASRVGEGAAFTLHLPAAA